MSVLDDDSVVYVARVATSRIMTVSINVGTRFPAHATSMGRVLLAGLPDHDLDAYLARVKLAPTTRRTITSPEQLRAAVERVRTQGWAIVDQELEDGLRAVAAPLHDRDGRVVAAMNISTHSSRMSLAQMRSDLLPALLATAGRIEGDLALAGGGRRGRARGA